MFRRKPFLHLPVPHATAQELPGGYARAPCLAFQRVVVRCRHLHREAVFQLICRSLLGAASLVSSYCFLLMPIRLLLFIIQIPIRPTGCSFHGVHEWEQAVSVCPKHKLAPLKTPLDWFRVTLNCTPSIRFLKLTKYPNIEWDKRKSSQIKSNCFIFKWCHRESNFNT